MSKFMNEKFLNKEVQIYPRDTYYKYGIVRDINEHGVVFEITRSNANGWPVGGLKFVAYSKELTFVLINQ